MSNDQASITCVADGPYLLKGEGEAEVTLKVQKAEGEKVSEVNGVALCRCGASRNKPFCDGTHGKIGFSDENLVDGSQNRRQSYSGRQITIHDNRGICAHAGYCTDNLASVFRMGKEPWIDADGASVEAIIGVIESCPSGALGYSLDDGNSADPGQSPMVTVIKDGPYAVCAVELAGQSLGEGVSTARYTLCRCGASKNKPFCDGSHWHIGFSDDAG